MRDRAAVVWGICFLIFCGPAVPGQTPTPAPVPSMPGAGGSGRTTSASGPNVMVDGNRTPESTAIFVSGRVMLSDGTAPPDGVTVERVCGMRIIPEASTDRKGRFSFQVGRESALLMDAANTDVIQSRPRMAVRSGFATAPLMGCELRAALPGFRSSVINLDQHRALENPEVGTIILRRLANVQGLTISATSLSAPAGARKAYDKGHLLLRGNKAAAARAPLEKAVAAYPKYAAAWYDLGIVRSRASDLDGARTAFEHSIAADDHYLNPYDGLAQLATREKKWEEAARLAGRMIELNRIDFPRAYFLHGLAMFNLGQLEEAHKSAQALLAADPAHRWPRGEQLMGVILARKRDYVQAAAHLRRFVELAPEAPDADTARQQLADLEKLVADARVP